MIRDGPIGAFAVQRAQYRRVAGGKVADQHPEPSGGEGASVPVEEVGGVVAQEIGFEGLGVFFDERGEAQPSPRPIPVSLP